MQTDNVALIPARVTLEHEMRMNYLAKALLIIVAVCLALAQLPASADVERPMLPTRALYVSDYIDKMRGGWVGQMVGVGWGAPTEFAAQGEMLPEDRVPKWAPDVVNQFSQDDLYVEMTFVRTLEQYGLDCSIRQAGIDFASSQYPLWHANLAGRQALRSGIAPPDSGHPAFNTHADDIDYQIEADFSGLIAPGMPRLVVELGEKFGRLMNYGDGVYGGQFVGAMYAAAFFESDPAKLIQEGLRSIPRGSQYSECIRDVVRWHKQHPDDWRKSWDLINDKYHLNPTYRAFSCTGKSDKFNIDAKINGAYIVMGLLYGEGDIEKTIRVSMLCGQDSDCNPSNAAGILCTAIGANNLPDRYKSGLNTETLFSNTPYNFDSLIKTCEKLTRQAVVRSGGAVEADEAGREYFLIPLTSPVPSALEQSHKPGPAANVRYTKDELANISMPAQVNLTDAIKKFAPGWKVTQCGVDMNPGLLPEWNGRSRVLLTHPLDNDTACVLRRNITLKADGKPMLKIVAGHHPLGDWELAVRVSGSEILREVVGKQTATDGWLTRSMDLSEYRGRKISIEVHNAPTGWSFEAAYWGEVSLTE